MPVTCSFMVAFMREVLARMSRKVSRMRRRKNRMKNTTGGMADKLDQITEGLKCAGREQVEHGIDVVGDARDEPADQLVIEETEPQPVQEAEHVAAHVGHGSRPHHLHRVELNEAEELLDQHDH